MLSQVYKQEQKYLFPTKMYAFLFRDT